MFATRCPSFPHRIIPPFLAADPRVDFEKRMASVEALAAAGEQLLLADVAVHSYDAHITHAAADRFDDQLALVAIARSDLEKTSGSRPWNASPISRRSSTFSETPKATKMIPMTKSRSPR